MRAGLWLLAGAIAAAWPVQAPAHPVYEGYVTGCFEGKVTRRGSGRAEVFEVQIVNRCGASYVVQVCARPADGSGGWRDYGDRVFLMNNQPHFEVEPFARAFEYSAVGCALDIPGGCALSDDAHDPHCPK